MLYITYIVLQFSVLCGAPSTFAQWQPSVEYKVTNEKLLRQNSGPRKDLSTKKLTCSNTGINSS